MGRKFLYILGASGTGKSVLANLLPEIDPDNYHRVIQYTTRPIRDGEIDGEDYKFITSEEFDEMHFDGHEQGCGSNFFEWVTEQYSPYKYGAIWEDLDDEKWNIVVACIEGLLTGISTSFNDEIRILNIVGVPFTERESRNAFLEEKFNKSVINAFIEPYDPQKQVWINQEDQNEIYYREITTQTLREMSDDQFIKFLEDLWNQ